MIFLKTAQIFFLEKYTKNKSPFSSFRLLKRSKMGLCASAPTDEQLASQKIDRQMRDMMRSEQAKIKLLLLGCGEVRLSQKFLFFIFYFCLDRCSL